MAPVGSEVVLVSGLYGARREFVARQPLEWTLSGDSVGQIVSTADDENCAADLFRNASVRKTGNRAVTQTSTSTMVLTRGTPNRGDDVTLLRGQSWVTVTSPTAGTTYVTVMAPQAYNWDQRRQTAAIHWVDVQWRVPPPAIVQASQPHLLSTEVQRTSGKPLPGWIVRYELSESAGPGLDAQGRSILEAVTDEAGRASVNLVPANRSGSCQVEVKIIRPSNPDDDLPRMVVGRGWTSVNWSAADPQVTLTGPE
jgi:hypothetical protein